MLALGEDLEMGLHAYVSLRKGLAGCFVKANVL